MRLKNDIERMVSILQTAFENGGKSKMKFFVDFIQKNESNCSRASEVKVKWKSIIILAGNNHVNCKSNAGLVKKWRTIFQSKFPELPEDIHSADYVIMLKLGIRNYFKVPVINDSSHDSN